MKMKEGTSLKNQKNVPKLFKAAAKILKLVKENCASVKTIIYDKKYKHHNIPALFALVNEANKKWDVLDKIIEKTGIFRNNPKLNPWLGRILMVDVMRGKCCKSECIPVLYVQQYADAIRKTVAANTDFQKDNISLLLPVTSMSCIQQSVPNFSLNSKFVMESN